MSSQPTKLNRSSFRSRAYPNRVLQFGEGNFLRAFADWMIHEMNQKANFNAGVTVVQPIEKGLIELLNEQEGLYTLYLNGIKDGKALSEHLVIDCIQQGVNPYSNYRAYLDQALNPDLRFVLSNTTEAGISYDPDDALEDMPQKSFPAKLTSLLFKRYRFFKGAKEKGLILIPCELIDRNGDQLKGIILKYAQQWNLEKGFVDWIDEHNIFCNTLVDRIVPGYPKARIDTIIKELGYVDNLVVEGELFHLWVIEGPESIKEEFPTEASGLNVVFTDNLKPFRTRKVRILNGAHTCLVPVGYLYGIDNVRESIENETVGKFIKDVIFEEICPTLELPKEDLHAFANDVLDRFRNPYLDHELIAISLNSVSKFKTRVLPSMLEFIKIEQEPPKGLLFSLASLIAFYKGEVNGIRIPLNDDQDVLDFFEEQWNNNAHDLEKLVTNVLSQEQFWGMDLTPIANLQAEVLNNLQRITKAGMKTALKEFLLTNNQYNAYETF